MVCFSFNEMKTKKTLIGLGLGQIISLLATFISFTSSEIARKGINAPMSQSFLAYPLLAIIYGATAQGCQVASLPPMDPISATPATTQECEVASHAPMDPISAPLTDVEPSTPSATVNLTALHSPTALENANLSQETIVLTKTLPTDSTPTIDVACSSSPAAINTSTTGFPPDLVKWYNYFLLALVDVEANFLVVKAYQYTSMTSVMLLDCWAIPCVLALTWLFLKTKYRLMKISGVVICILGVVMAVFSDVHAGDRAGGSNPVKGDFLVIAASTLYAVSNVSEEFLVMNADRIELMSFLGLFGAVICAVQVSIFERGALKAIHWSTETVLLCVGIAVALFLFYSLLIVLLKTNGSAMFTLSLLTSDIWTVLIRNFIYHEKVDWLYYLAFATTTIGLIIYSMKEKDEEEEQSNGEQRKLLDEENSETLTKV